MQLETHQLKAIVKEILFSHYPYVRHINSRPQWHLLQNATHQLKATDIICFGFR